MSNRRLSLVTGEIRPISDKSKLLWSQYYGPLKGAHDAMIAALNNAHNIIGGIILANEGVTSETHIFDADNLRIIPRPREKGQNSVGK